MNYYTNNIRHVKGDTLSFGLVVEGLGKQLDSAYFTCRDGRNDNSEILFQKRYGDGISITEEEEDIYKYAVRVDPKDTYNLQTGTYFYDLEVRVNGDVFTIMKGNFIIEQDSTRESENYYGKYAPRYISFRGYTGTELNYEISNMFTDNLTNMSYMFGLNYGLQSLDLSSFNTSNVTDMNAMFSGCSSLTSLDFSSFDTSKVTDMSYMIQNCSSLTSLDLSNFNTSRVTTMRAMFGGCSSLTSLNLSSFNTSNVTKMNFMFSSCSSLTSLNLSSFNTSNVTNVESMFEGCSSLTSLDLSNFYTPNVTSVMSMFGGCSSLTSLDVRNFTFSNATYYGGMLTSVPTTCEIIVKDNTEKAWFNSHFSSWTNVKTVDEL